MHRDFDSYYAQEKTGSFSYGTAKKWTIASPVAGFCSQTFSLQIIPIFLCLHLYASKKHPLKSSKQPYKVFWPLFVGRWWGCLKGSLFCLCLCAHMHGKALKHHRFGLYHIDPKPSSAVNYIYTKERPLVMLISFHISFNFTPSPPSFLHRMALALLLHRCLGCAPYTTATFFEFLEF